jgi:C1A family cysteine protease
MRLTYPEVLDALNRADNPWIAQPSPINLSRSRLRRQLGYKRSPGEPTREEAEAGARRQRHDRTKDTPYPPKSDLRDAGGVDYVTPVRDQRPCAACVAFAALAALEATRQFKARDPSLRLDYSEAHLFHCSPGCLKCAFGWRIPLALERLTAEGVLDDACLPYKPSGGCGKRCDGWETRLTKIRGFKPFKEHEPEAMKSWLASEGALITTMSVYEDFGLYYASGRYRHVAGAYSGEHAVCCIGFDDDAKLWICKNSWWTKWGDGGFFRIGYGECGIGAQMWGLLT